MVYSCIHVSRYCETSHLHQCLFVCRGGGGCWGDRDVAGHLIGRRLVC